MSSQERPKTALEWVRGLQARGWHCSDAFIAEFELFARQRVMVSEADAMKAKLLIGEAITVLEKAFTLLRPRTGA